MKTPKTWFRLYLAALLVTLPCTAHANTGTVLFMAGFTHLVLLNLLIGPVEGLVIALLFRIRAREAIGMMTLANYFSAFMGFVLFIPLFIIADLVLGSATIYDLWWRIWLYVAAIYLVTVLLEWPFCARLFRRSRPKGVRTTAVALAACAIAQIVSFAGLVPYYESAMGYNVYTSLSVDRSLSFTRQYPATVYFRRHDGVYKIRTDGSGLTKLLDTKATGRLGDLFVENREGAKHLELWVWTHNLKDVMLSDHLATGITQYAVDNPGIGWSPESFLALDTRAPGQHDWYAKATMYGAFANNRVGVRGVGVGLRLPFFEWRADSANILPGDLVVAEVGGQIIIFDPHSRKMGLLAMGRNPVATPADDKVIDQDIRTFAKRISQKKAH